MKAFRCSRTGLLYPEDYVEEWGRKYGIGLGSVPVSEALVNDYHRPPVGSSDTGMHALSVARAQVDLCEVTPAEFEENKAIVDAEDIGYRQRAPLMRAKQLIKSGDMMNKYPASVQWAKDHLKAIADEKAAAIKKIAAVK